MKPLHVFVFASLLLLMCTPGCEKDPPDSPIDASTNAPATAAYAETIEPTSDDATDQDVRVNNSLAIDLEQPQAPSAFVIIQNAGPKDPALLVRQLQQVLPKTQVVKLAQSPNTREIKLEVTNTRDVRALANKIPFASVESVDVQKRTITVDFDL